MLVVGAVRIGGFEDEKDKNSIRFDYPEAFFIINDVSTCGDFNWSLANYRLYYLY